MRSPQRINLLITIFDLHFGGISNLILQTAPALNFRMNVEVIYFGPKKEMLQRYINAGINTTRIPYAGSKDSLKAGKELAKFIKSKNIDVVSTHLFVDKTIVAIARRFTPFKILSTIHSANKPYPLKYFGTVIKNKVEDIFHNRVADKNFAVSNASLQSWIKYRNFKNNNSRVLYSGIEELPCIKSIPTDFENKDKIFITACRFTKEKGLERLINLFSKIDNKKNNWQFWILGSGLLELELEEIVSKLNLEKHIIFKGFQTELCEFYNQADFYINGSYHEALPVSIIESMSVGLPIIGSNVGGIPELIDSNKNGYLVDFNNSEESLSVLKDCIHMSHNRYESFSKASRQIFRSKFTIETYVKEFEKEMIDLVN